jgi:hypothetical protein
MKKKSTAKKPRKCPGNGGARKGAGRPKGARNKDTLEFRNAAREHTDRAIALHAEVMDQQAIIFRAAHGGGALAGRAWIR